MDLFTDTAFVAARPNFPVLAVMLFVFGFAVVFLFRAARWLLRLIKRAFAELSPESRRARRVSFEPVHEVTDYFQGPRTGIADFRGVPHNFVSLNWSLADGADARWDWEDDRFTLSPVEGGFGDEPIIAKGKFRLRRKAPKLPPGVIRPLEVRWTVTASQS